MTFSIRRAAAVAAISLSCAALAAASALPAGWRVAEADARDYALDSLAGGQFNYWAFKAGWTATPQAARAALVQGGLEWVKAYAASPLFAHAYAKRRNEAKPEPTVPMLTVDQEMAAERAQQKKDLDEYKAQIKQMPPDTQKAMLDMAKMMEDQQKQFAADAQMQAMIRQGKEMERVERKQRDAQSLARWQKDWPVDPKPLIAKRLREFLAACADVDFAAKTIHDPAIDKLRFAETRYEMKPAEWKYCYRAGKAPVEAARSFATAWLKELPAG
jgi:hypothetical protein